MSSEEQLIVSEEVEEMSPRTTVPVTVPLAPTIPITTMAQSSMASLGANTRTVTILNDLPKFKGNARKQDIAFQPGIPLKTFLRTLQNYFVQNNIDEDNEKIRILFAQVDKTQGNAIDFLNVFAGIAITYEELEKALIKMYPNVQRTNLKYAAKTVLEDKIDTPSYFSGMTRLQTNAREPVEAYLTTEAMGKIGINVVNCETWKAEATSEGKTISIADLLHNFIVHIVTAIQLTPKLFKHVKKITPDRPNIDVMTTVVKEAEEAAVGLALECRKAEKKASDVVFEVKKMRECVLIVIKADILREIVKLIKSAETADWRVISARLAGKAQRTKAVSTAGTVPNKGTMKLTAGEKTPHEKR